MPASLESSAGTAPSVLLIEEYDALAAAITSALKKFAPQHRTRAVESLSEAEAAAAQTDPQLLVIDFDPPHPKTVEFLSRISATYPEARALVITSGMPPEVASERFGPNGIQFVEKPFELAEFGAAVQALLGPWTEAASGDSRGTLRDLNLKDLVPLECVGGTTAILTVAAEGGRAGEIHFLDGHICHAIAPGLEGMDAFVEIMRWRRANGKENERPTNGPRTIHAPWQHVFLEALRKAKPASEDLKDKPAASSVELSKTARVAPKGGKSVVVIDDTEMLLIFVEDVLSTADPSLQITTASTGGDGATQVETISPDLVLLDYSLPDLRGDQVCERLLTNDATARIPVVIMSGHVPEMMATAERCPNVVATIAKPFMSGALIALVKKALAQGPLPSGPRKGTTLISPVKESPSSVVPPPAKPARHEQEKQSASKGSLPSVAKEPPKPISSTRPVVVASPPLSLAPSSSIEMTEPPSKVAAPTASHRPVTPGTRSNRPGVESRPPSPAIRPARLAPPADAVLLRLGMEVVSAQFTPRFQVDTIRARPSPATLSLTQIMVPPVVRDRWAGGFELGTVELSADGRIRTLRVRPMRRPASAIRARNGFDINDVKLVNGTAHIQLTAGMSVPMTIQVLAIVKVVEVELSERFEVAQLILQLESSRVRATLDPESRGAAGVEFETVRVHLDSSARITEFILQLASAD